MSNLEDARLRAEEMFGKGAENAIFEETAAETMSDENAEQIKEPTTSESVPAQMAEEAISSAEELAQVAQEKESELAQMTEKLGENAKEIKDLKNMIEQMSRQQEEAVVEDMLQPPAFDAEKILYGDAESQSRALADYQSKLNEYNKAMIRKDMEAELAPLLQFVREGMLAKEKADALKAIKEAMPELVDIDAKLPMIDAMIEQNPFLATSDKPMEEKYLMAYMLSKGVDAINTPPKVPEPPKAPTAQELMEYAKSNKEFAEMLAMERIASVQNGQQVPQFSASSGAVNAAPTIQNTPTNLEEAKEQFKKMFRA